VSSALREQAVTNARSMSAAADSLLRALPAGGDNLERAADRLESRAAAVLDDSVAAFDSTQQGQAAPSDEELLADSLSQFSIGLTLIAADTAMSSAPQEHRLGAAIADLDRTADVLEAASAEQSVVRGFDTHPGGEGLSVKDAALAALDEMAATAATVATSLVSRTIRPLIDHLPDDLGSALAKLNADVTGRFLRWGLRAVRRGLDLLLSMADLPAVERVRDRIDHVLVRLGQGSDPAVLTGWAIGVEDVREKLSSGSVLGASDNEDLVATLAELASRYSSLCTLLKRIAAVITGLAAALALVQITVPHSLAITTAGLVLVLGTLIVLGRDYTGANDLPGSVRGVRLLVLER
jgi:hypothetical protein